MPGHPNVIMLRDFYRAFTSGDVSDFFDDEVFVHHVVGTASGGTHHGKSDCTAVINAYRTAATDGLDLDIHDVLANDAHGMAIVRVTARRRDAVYDQYETHVFEIVAGTIAGIFVYRNDPAPADAFFGE